MTPDGARWLAMREGVLRDSAGVQRWFPLPHGPVWSMAVTRALEGGVPTLVLATAKGVALGWTDKGFTTLPLPPTLPPHNLMVATSTRDNVHALWLGSLKGGVARLAQSHWTVFGAAEGLSAEPSSALSTASARDVHIEHLVATPAGDSVEMLATAQEGVYGLIRGRWHQLHAGGVHLRAMRFVRNGRIETWTSLSNGEVLSDGGGSGWHAIRAAERTPSGPARALTVQQEPDGSALVFAAYTGGELLRIRTDRAERLPVPSAYTNSAVRTIFADGAAVYIGMRGTGILTFADSRLRDALDSVRVMAVVRTRTVRDGGVWIATATNGVWWRTSSGWVQDPGSPTGGPLSAIGDGLSQSGKPALIVGNSVGRIYARTNVGWSEFTNLPFTGQVIGVLTDTIRGQPTMLVASTDGFWRYDGVRWRQVKMPPGMLDVLPTGFVRQTFSNAPARVIALTRSVGLLRIGDTDTAVVIPLTDAIDDTIRETLALADAGDGDLLVGTDNGLLKLALSPNGRTAHVVASFADEDGLPHNAVTAVAPADSQNVWVGTLKGTARLNLRRAQRPLEPGALTVVVRKELHDAIDLANGETVSWAERDLRFAFTLRTDYREDDLLYRYELTGPVQLSQPWTLESTASLRALPAGTYTLRVWGSRRYSAAVGPLVRTFRIAPPAWRSPLALMAYVLAAGFGVWGLVRWRLAGLKQQHRAVVDQQRQLTENERRFRVLFEESADAQLLIDGQTIVAANPAAALLLTSDRDVHRLRGQPVMSFIPQLTPGVRVESLDGAETTVCSTHGETYPVQLRGTTMPYDGADIAFVELRDLREVQQLAAEREILEQQLRESQRLEALGTLAGGVAHDFNNLLTVIRNGAELATAAAADGHTDQESLAAISHASDRARDLVRQILTFSRRVPTRRDPIVLDALVRELQPMIRATLPVTIRLETRLDAGTALVLGDRTQLMQVLLNLATNAEYAMRDTLQAELIIRTDLIDLPPVRSEKASMLPAGPYIRLRVSDNGIGIPEEVRARIFEPFFTTKDVGEGTGLGLSVLHGIVTAHGGTVSVVSAKNAGATFEILMPLASSPLGAEPHPQAVLALRTTAAVHVLLADDEPLVLASTRRLLMRNGFTVTACASGREALASLAGAEHYDVMITDFTMPDMTGDVLAREARARRPDLPVIMVTGVGADVDGLAHDAGILEVLRKPYGIRDLADAIDRALRVVST